MPFYITPQALEPSDADLGASSIAVESLGKVRAMIDGPYESIEQAIAVIKARGSNYGTAVKVVELTVVATVTFPPVVTPPPLVSYYRAFETAAAARDVP